MRVAMPGGRVSALTRLAAMPGQKRVAGALAVAAAAVAISACGSSSGNPTIPSTNATQLTTALNAVEAAVNQGKCNRAQAEAQNFIDAVNQLPDTVGTTDKEKLRSAGENLQKLAQEPSQCKPTPIGTSGAQGAQTTTTTSTPTVVPTPTSTTTTTSTTSEPPGNSGGNQGGGPPNGTPPGQTGGGDTGGGQTGGGAAGGGGGTGTGGSGGTGVGGGGGTG
jgi:hypothetical protein